MDSQMDNQARLLLREWICVIFVCSMMVTLACVAWYNGRSAAQELQVLCAASPEKIQLTLTGAVETPGIYAFPAGISMREVLRKVPLKKEAGRKGVDLKRCYYDSATIHIPSKQKVEKKKRKE